MSERYKPEFPRGKIAQAVEIKAGKEFGPEGLKKADVARCLNIKPSDMTDEEWGDISEFAVNAGASIIQAAIAKDFPPTISPDDVRPFSKRIEKNEDKILPFHDLFHAAETYRLNKGTKASSRFIEVDSRDRYTDSQAVSAELYPLLFFANPSMKAPLPVLLYSSEGRETIARFFTENYGFSKEACEEITEILSAPDSLISRERRRQYEDLVESVIIGGTQIRIENVTPETIQAMREAFQKTVKNPPEHYANFAARVFNEEWHTNPRLFLDELLECIRTKPELTA